LVSLAGPGGNVTGVTFFAVTLIAGKRLELIKQLIPKARRVAVLSNPSNASHTAFTRDLKLAARTLGTEIQIVAARYPDELAGAFAAIARNRAGSLLVLTDAMFFGERESIAKLAADSALPAIYAYGSSSMRAGSFRMARTSLTCSDALRAMSTRS
jgi:putative ABC transport system substrate-binding protein